VLEVWQAATMHKMPARMRVARRQKESLADERGQSHMTYVCNMSKDGVYCAGPNGPITLEEFRAQLDKMASRPTETRPCACKIEMATFRHSGERCQHCGKIIMFKGTP
jgi:hypothetical protein